ncbi:MAG: hypothetical protein AAGH76_14405 [Pseudomonadota bacterium]
MTADRPLKSTICAGTALLCLAVAWCSVGHGQESTTYRAAFVIDMSAASTRASLTIEQAAGELRALTWTAQPHRWNNFVASAGKLTKQDDRWTWQVPNDGGRLAWDVTVDQRRGKYVDARRTDTWALFRGDDAFPAMASTALASASAAATLRIIKPKDWSFVTAWPAMDDGRYRVDNPARRFDRPTGWMLAGQRLGVRIDDIAGSRVVVAAPSGQNARRQDILALLNWVLPTLRSALLDLPDRLVLVLADDPFWRGGLSGPNSLFLHVDRPLISENGTSTLTHEVFHVAFRRPGGELDDWIIEGLAEYYSTWLLHRSGTTSEQRFNRTLAALAKWADSVSGLRGDRSSGPVTAKAALLFHALNLEIEAATDGRRNLDHVVRRLIRGKGPVTLTELRAVTGDILGRDARTLSAVPSQGAD